jgi:hypothetical protein
MGARVQLNVVLHRRKVKFCPLRCRQVHLKYPSAAMLGFNGQTIKVESLILITITNTG